MACSRCPSRCSPRGIRAVDQRPGPGKVRHCRVADSYRLGRWEFASGVAHRTLLAIHETNPSPDFGHFIVGGLLPSWEDAFIFREGFLSALRLTYDKPDLRAQQFSRGAFDNLVSEASAGTESVYLDFRTTPCGPDVTFLVSPLVGRDGNAISAGSSRIDIWY